MLQKIKKAFSWLMEKIKAGAAWLQENRPWLQEQGREIARKTYKVVMDIHRQVWAKFNRGRALAILTVLYRQSGNTTFRQALEQAKAEVRSMSEAEIAYMVVNFFTDPAEAQMLNAAT